MTHTNITNEHADLGTKWLAADRCLKEVKEITAELRADLISDISEDEGEHLVIVTPIGKVQVVDKDVRSFDVERLIRLVGESALFNAGVIEFKVNPTKFDEALEADLFNARVVSKVVTSEHQVAVSEYTADIP